MREALLIVGFVASCLTCSLVSEPGSYVLTHDQLLVPPVVAALGLEPILLFAGNALCRLYVLYILRDFVQPLFLVSCFFWLQTSTLVSFSFFFLCSALHTA